MEVFETLAQWISCRATLPAHHSLGFVPTMGNLHKGHSSLLKRSKAENDATIASLFINPTQFNNASDFANYPKTLENDLKLMEEVGVDFCILPREADIYPAGYRYRIQESPLAQTMEGLHRPGHFDGMLTIVMKLLQLTKPTRAYFGEKDYQQYLLVQGMCHDFFLNVDIIPCPTIREHSGLAYSSRNALLSPSQKNQAEQFAQIFHQTHQSCEAIIQELRSLGIEVEYIEEAQGRRFAAVKIGSVRLIDNYLLSEVSKDLT
jgi:pantoate--beta-alanine ligase